MASGSSKRGVRKYHDRVAHAYDDSYDDHYWRFHDGMTWDHVKRFLPTTAGAPTLDLGCGTGKWGLKLLASGFSVTFVDISSKMLDAARNKVTTDTARARSQFIQSDLMELSGLEAGAYRFALAMGEPLCSTDSPLEAVRRIGAALVKDGIMVATLDNKLACYDHYFERGKLEEFDKFSRDGRTHWLTRDKEERFTLQTFTPKSAARLFEKSGFEVIDMIGKFALPIRNYRSLLADAAWRKTLMGIEKGLWKEPTALARAAHLQIVARKI